MTASERQRRRRARRKDPARVILIAGGALFGALALAVLAGVAVVAAIAHEVPPLKALKPLVRGEASTVYYSDGGVAGLIPSTVLRNPIPLSKMSRYVRQATVAIEDQRFWSTGAIDPLSLARAAITDLTSGKTLQGGSTITMQLVRNLYLPDDHSFKFKIKEAVIAERLEQAHSKKWILRSYLNYVPYGTVDGQTAEGVEAASWIFFDRPASEDTLVQAALLAGLPQAPSDYNPFKDPRAAKQRRNTVLTKMEQLGYISPATADAARHAGLELHPNHHYKLGGNYLTDFIRTQLIRKYGRQRLEDGGLRVYTTINPHLGSIAKHSIAGVLDLPTDPSAALVSENPANGYVDTMAQSGTYSQSQYNLATQAQRQPGSTFKAIVLADALAHGIDPFTTDYLSHTLEAGWIPVAPTYTVTIDGGGSLNSDLNLDQALVASDNTVFAQLAADLTESSVTKMAYALGVTTHLSSYPAEALGGLTYGVTPLEMANVYATIADGGIHHRQITIKKVVFPDGSVDSSWGVPHGRRVLSRAAALVETEILQHNVEYGTATGSAISCPSAAKTGTTSRLVDAWLDGFTPGRTTVVWMGYPKANVPMNDVHGQPQFGGLLPADIWHDFMTAVVTPPCQSFASPDTDPMTYVPFSGSYQRAGQAAYIPPSTGASGATGAAGAGGGTTTTKPPAGGTTTHTHQPSNPPATTTTPTTPPPPATTTTPSGGAQAPTGST